MSINFSEEIFDNQAVQNNMTSSISFSTTVISVNGGFEQRNANWSQARGSYEYGLRDVSEEDFDYLKSFFCARQGKKQGFRARDWSDYKVELGRGAVGKLSLFDDTNLVYKLYKKYVSGDETYFDRIQKPRLEGFTVNVDGSQYALNTEEEDSFTLDTIKGTLTYIPIRKNILNVSQDTQLFITFDEPHGFTAGRRIRLFISISQIDDQFYTINQVVDPNTIRIDIDTRTAYINDIITGLTTTFNTSNVHNYNVGEQIRIFNLVRNGVPLDPLVLTVLEATENTLTVNLDSFVDPMAPPEDPQDIYTITQDTYAISVNQTMKFDVYEDSIGGATNYANYFLPNGTPLDWFGIFDVPVRFDTDSFQHQVAAIIHSAPDTTNTAKTYMSLGSIPLVRIKLPE